MGRSGEVRSTLGRGPNEGARGRSRSRNGVGGTRSRGIRCFSRRFCRRDDTLYKVVDCLCELRKAPEPGSRSRVSNARMTWSPLVTTEDLAGPGQQGHGSRSPDPDLVPRPSSVLGHDEYGTSAVDSPTRAEVVALEVRNLAVRPIGYTTLLSAGVDSWVCHRSVPDTSLGLMSAPMVSMFAREGP